MFTSHEWTQSKWSRKKWIRSLCNRDRPIFLEWDKLMLEGFLPDSQTPSTS